MIDMNFCPNSVTMLLADIIAVFLVCYLWRCFSSGNNEINDFVCCLLHFFPPYTCTQHTVYNELLTQNNLMFVQSILEICSIETTEGGDYTCNATNGLVSETNTTTITVVDSRGGGIVSLSLSSPLARTP